VALAAPVGASSGLSAEVQAGRDPDSTRRPGRNADGKEAVA